MAFMGLTYAPGFSGYVQSFSANNVTLQAGQADAAGKYAASLNFNAWDTIRSKYVIECGSVNVNGLTNALEIYSSSNDVPPTTQNPQGTFMLAVNPPTASIPTGNVTIPNLQASPFVLNFDTNITPTPVSLGIWQDGVTVMVSNVTGAVFDLPDANGVGVDVGDTFTFIVKNAFTGTNTLQVAAPSSQCIISGSFIITAGAWVPSSGEGTVKQTITLPQVGTLPGDYIRCQMIGGGAPNNRWAVSLVCHGTPTFT